MKRMKKRKRTVLRRVPGARRKVTRRLAKVVLVLVVAGALLATAGRAYLRGDWLTVTRIEVTGNRHWDAYRLLETAGVETGTRLHELPFRAARRRLEKLPGIEKASMLYLPGGNLRLHVREADVLAVRHSPDRTWLGLTHDGSWMRLADAISEDAPVLEAGKLSGENAARLAAFLGAARAGHPDVFGGFGQISTRTSPDGEAVIYWRDGKLRLRVDYTASRPDAFTLLRELLRTERDGWRAGTTVDLRVEGYAYVR